MGDEVPQPVDDADNLLELIREAGFSEPVAKEDFFADLARFQRLSERQKRQTVSRAAIRMWKLGEMKPRRAQALEFFDRYLSWSRTVRPFTDHDIERVNAYESARRLIARSQTYPPVDEEKAGHAAAGPGYQLDATLKLGIQTLLGISGRSSHSEAETFFRGSSAEAVNDASYYLCYRYSTNHGAVVKSFVVLRKPLKDVRSTFVFNEFIGGGSHEGFSNHLYRESEGFIAKMERGFYFLGSNFNIPVDKKIDPEVYAVQRRLVRWKPNGLVMSAFEYDDIRLRPGLFGGVTMTVADLSQPIVGRLAMLHIGVRSGLGITMTDDLVQPGEMRADQLAADLEEVVDRIKDRGARRLSPVLEKAYAPKGSAGRTFRRVQDDVLALIGNAPAWETAQSREKRLPVARGALETIGPGRPRE